MGNSDAYTILKGKLEHLPENVVVIGSHTQLDNRKEKVCPVVQVFFSPLSKIYVFWGLDE